MNESALAAHDTTRAILSAFYYVYNQLGHGFVESVYQRALGNTLERTGHAVAREAPLTVVFESRVVGLFRADLIVDQCVIVEAKAVEQLAIAHEAQLLNYLHAAQLPVGLLLNFGPRATFRRLVGRAALDAASRERAPSEPPPYVAPRISG
ncbi:MAG: GxxExxY protein [Gemmatimonadetes bacterium]|nr:GxxExxY protein [Gemmatimonadota bacterium]